VSFTSAPYRKKFSKLQAVGRQKNSENHSEFSLFSGLFRALPKTRPVGRDSARQVKI
jgi:hypothetical protein